MSGETLDNGTPITIWPPTEIRQTARERLADLIRTGAINWKRSNDPEWRDKPYFDGVVVDLEEAEVVDWLVDYIIARTDPDRPWEPTS